MHWRARIATADGVPRGAGVLVDGARLITCAHVVDGLTEVSVTLPGVAEALPAAVAWTGDWRCLGDRGDVAVVELGEPVGVPPCAFAPLDLLRPREGQGTRELRALGFPFGHEKDGTHVTLRTSADRLLGQEWLEIDVEQAHLQRLGEGFSGAAVYDPGSRLVVGIVTDALLDGDQEGYIGRMLPLDTIRRHWEALDDLLPLDWLPDMPRRELRALFDGVRLDPGTLELTVRRAFPTFRRPLPAFRSAWHAIRYVGEELTGEERLSRLLRELGRTGAAGVDAGPWLRRWMPERYDEAAHAGPAARPAAPPTGSVVFRAQSMTRGGAIDLSVSTVVDGVPVGRAGPVRVRRQHLRTKTEALLAEQIGGVHGVDWMLEFVVPEGLMSEPFEEWQIREPGAARPRPMRTVPVVVRHLDRLEPLLASHLAGRRWATVRARGETRPRRVECGLPYGYEEFHDWLDADDQLCALAYAATPAPDWLSAALDTGVPIMLWRRRDCGVGNGEGNHAHCAPEKFLDRITEAVASLDPARLPHEVMRLRKEARSPDKGDAEHCGHRLTLFWDGAEGRADPPLAAGTASASGTRTAHAAGAAHTTGTQSTSTGSGSGSGSGSG
ncbi:trypsin-like peptidase domain-containing protein [Streptomyces sp. KN37]|uniref:VMAP-C domain-containing protein n=1 Tax=Streptomyces sp. KN37 TaxID=3090667 RepID=UPI002A7585F1|nr:trypsin-like peptidase domain-containing protein [Streptomyces sp. KN37]WPO70056.1 trypsin-like peptidase domain-containing protein [Streptomyces sp. KN37]